MKKTLNIVRRSLLWPVATINNFIICLVGIIDPRDFLCYTFNYVPIAFLNHNGRSKFRIWFDSTDFGPYWKSSNYSNRRKIGCSKRLQWLLRVRWIFAVPTETLHCLLENDWCDKHWKMMTRAHLSYMVSVIKNGDYEDKTRYERE